MGTADEDRTSARARIGAPASADARPRSALAHVFVDAAVLGEAGVDVAVRVDADAVDVAAREAGEHRSLPVADADLRRLAVVFLLGDVEIAVLAAADVVGAAHAGPLAEEIAVGREDLDALVGPVGDVELASIVERNAVRQMELARAMTRRSPRLLELAVAAKAVNAG